MKEIVSTVLSAIMAFMLICFAAWYVSAPAPSSNIRYDQIQTDDAKQYPHKASADRGWAVEMIDPDSKIQIDPNAIAQTD